MKEITALTYFDHEIRTSTNDSGEVWFVASDICDYFGVSNRNRVMQQVEDEDKGGTRIDTPGGRQLVTTVNEAGLYSILFALQPQQARGVDPDLIDARIRQVRAFKRWVTHDVLPAIRRTGSYSTAPVHALPQSYAEALRELADTAERADVAERQIVELTPSAEAWDDLASAGGDFTITDASKVLARGGVSTGPMKLHAYLKDDAGWIFRRGGRWQAMQSAINAGHVVERITGGYYDDAGERQQGKPQVRLTATGIQKLHDLMRTTTSADVLQLPTDRNA